MFLLFILIYIKEKKLKVFYNNYGTHTVTIYFALRLLILLKTTKIIKIFIPVILVYGNKNVCLGFVGWLLYTFFLLKIIVNMKRCYMGVWGYIEKCVGFLCELFQSC